MADLVLTDMEGELLQQLQLRATHHGRTASEEAKTMLAGVLRGKGSTAWVSVDAIYEQLAASGRVFSDSASLLRKDRGR